MSGEVLRVVKLGDLVERCAVRNTRGLRQVLTASARHGLVDQREYFGKDVASTNLAGYSVVEPGDFVYSKSYSAAAPMGAVLRNRTDVPGVVSPLYVVFRVKSIDVEAHYLELAFASTTFLNSLGGLIREGARAHGAVNISAADFLQASIPLPSLRAQTRIVDLLSSADRLVDALASETDACRSAAEQLAENLLTSSALPRRELSNALTETTPQRVADPSQYEGLSVRLYGEGVVPSGKRPNTTANGRPYYVRRPGEILVGRQNFHNGATGVVPPTPSEMVTSNAISAFEIRDGYDKDFVVALLQTPSIYRSVLPLISGTGQKETGVKLLMSLSVPLPGIEEQRRISATLLAASQRLNAVQEQALAVRFLRDQLLHDLLSGAHTIPESYDRFLAEVPE